MKNNSMKYLIAFAISPLLYCTQNTNAESDFYFTDYKSMVYLAIPFGGGQTGFYPKLGFISTRSEINPNIETDDHGYNFVRNKKLINITFDLNKKQWSRFSIGGLNALDKKTPYLNFDGGINPTIALIGAGLIVGGIVVADATNSDSGNHMCEEHHEEENHAEFIDVDIIFNEHPCPEEEEPTNGGHHLIQR